MKRMMRFALMASAALAAHEGHATNVESYLVTNPVVQDVSYNGIGARLEIALVPSGKDKQLTDRQRELLEQYWTLEDKCRGGYPGPETDRACEERDNTSNAEVRSVLWIPERAINGRDVVTWLATRDANQYEIGCGRDRVFLQATWEERVGLPSAIRRRRPAAGKSTREWMEPSRSEMPRTGTT